MAKQILMCEDLEVKKDGFIVTSFDALTNEEYNMVIWREDYGYCSQHSDKVRFYIEEKE